MTRSYGPNHQEILELLEAENFYTIAGEMEDRRRFNCGRYGQVIKQLPFSRISNESALPMTANWWTKNTLDPKITAEERYIRICQLVLEGGTK